MLNFIDEIESWQLNVTSAIAKNFIFHRTLRKADIPIATDSECIAFYSKFSNTRQICAGGEKGKILKL